MSKARLTVTDKSMKKDEPLEQVYSLTKLTYLYVVLTCVRSLSWFLFLFCFWPVSMITVV